MRPLLPIALLALSGLASAAPELELSPATCEEGRPVTIKLEVELPKDQHLALLRLSAQAGAASAKRAYGQRRTALPLSPNLGPGVVSLELVASEDLSRSAVARLPRPDVRAGIEGPPFLLCRLGKPGERLSLEVSLTPVVGETKVRFGWKAFAVNPLAGGLFVRSRSQRWNPGDEDRPPRGPNLGGPPTLPRGPSSDGVSLRVELTRWAPWKGQAVGELLLDEEQTKTLKIVEGEANAALKIAPAAFGLADAAKRAGADPARAVRLADDRWILQRAGEWWVVPAEGEVARGKGEAFPCALDLARSGRAGFLWYGHGDQPKLATALREAGFAKSPGKGLPVEIEAARLVEFLRLLEAHGCGLSKNGIAPLG